MTAIWSAFEGLHPLAQAIAAGLATWAIIAVGAAVLFVRRDIPAGRFSKRCSGSRPG